MTNNTNTSYHKDNAKFAASRATVAAESTCHYSTLSSEFLALFDAPKDITEAEKKYGAGFVNAMTFVGARSRRLAGMWSEEIANSREKVCLFENDKQRKAFVNKYKYSLLAKHLAEFVKFIERIGITKDDRKKLYVATNVNTFHNVFLMQHNYNMADIGMIKKCVSNLPKEYVPLLEEMTEKKTFYASLRKVGKKLGEDAKAAKPVYEDPVIPASKKIDVLTVSHGEVSDAFTAN